MNIEITEEQYQTLNDAILEFNDQMITYRINISGQAFGNAFKLGCIFVAFPVLAILGIAFTQNKFDFSALFVYVCAGFMLAMTFAAIIATRAKQLAIQDNDQHDISSEIIHFLNTHHLSQQQFNQVANEILDPTAPLRNYLNKPISEEI